LQTIRDLDRQLNTEITYQFSFAPKNLAVTGKLDQALYRLQQNDQIELSSLQHVTAYTPEQIDAGIQDIGGPLFL